MTKVLKTKGNRAATTEPLLHDNDVCSHLHEAKVIDPKPGQYEVGCVDCNRIGQHGNWVHLRLCLTDGKVRCCDSSPNQHASKHAKASGDPLARSIEPGEAWVYCYQDQVQAIEDIHHQEDDTTKYDDGFYDDDPADVDEAA